jgi:putative transposase
MSDPLCTLAPMIPRQQQLPLRQWGGARPGAGRKRQAARRNVPHRRRRRFRRGTLHVTLRLRAEVWSLRTHRCFRALRRAFERGCQRFGYRLVHFSVQGNHIHLIVEAPDAVQLGRAMKGLEVRMARALNGVMRRRGPVFADRYHAHLLRSPREAANAVRYVLENWRVHGLCREGAAGSAPDPYCSAAAQNCGPALVAQPQWWMLCVGVTLIDERPRLAG